MNIQISFKSNKIKKNLENQVFFINNKNDVSNLKTYISKSEHIYISDLLDINDKQNNILTYDINSKRKIILVVTKKKPTTSETESLGAKFCDYLKDSKQKTINIYTDTNSNSLKDFIGYFLHGLKLKSYNFEKYKSKKKNKIISINLFGKNKPSQIEQIKFKAIEEGAFFARDLVSEPGNILHPDEYAKRLNLLKKIGLGINIYDEKKLEKLGMNTLLGVGQGSIRGSYLVTMEWKGLKNNSRPLAFVGKGVCFDTGGISLKPAKFM